MKEFNGHRSWNAWNVALWIGNDEGLYNLAVDCFRANKNVHLAARSFIRNVGTERTPDGGRYNATAVAEAIRGLELSR
jgi:hypothetical protein